MNSKLRKQKISDKKTLNWWFGAFLLLIGFVYTQKIVDPALIPRQILLGVFCLVLLLKSFKESETWVIFSRLNLFRAMGGLLIFGFISSLGSNIFGESANVFLRISLFFCFLSLMSYSLFNQTITKEEIIKAIIVFTSFFVIVINYQLYQYFFGPNSESLDLNYLTGVSANKNLCASALFLTLPFVISGITLSKPWRIHCYLLVFFITVQIGLIQSRSVYLGILLFLISAIVLSFVFIRNLPFKKQVYSLFLSLILGLIIDLFIIFISLSSFKLETAKNIESSTTIASSTVIQTLDTKLKSDSRLINTGTFDTRINLWNNSFEMLKDHFFLGVAPGNWQIYFPNYSLKKFDTAVQQGIVTYQRPHNDFIWILNEFGIIGFLFFSFFLVCTIYYSFQILKFETSKEIKWVYVMIISGIFGFGIISFFDFPFERIEHMILFMCMVAIICGDYLKIKNQEPVTKFNLIAKSINPIFLILITSAVIVSLFRLKGEYHSAKLYKVHQQGNWNKMIKEAENAKSVFYKLDPMSAPIAWYEGVAYYSLNNIDSALFMFTEAVNIHPYHIHALNNLGSCYLKKGEIKSAERFYIEALRISPEFHDAVLNLTALYFNEKQIKKAYEIISNCDIGYFTERSELFMLTVLKNCITQKTFNRLNESTIKALSLLSDKELLKYYFESKTKNIKFEEYILQNGIH